MSFFGDLLYSAAPIAAGFAFPGAPILAGAATGAGAGAGAVTHAAASQRDDHW